MGPSYLIGFTVGKYWVPDPGAGSAGAAPAASLLAGAKEVISNGQGSLFLSTRSVVLFLKDSITPWVRKPFFFFGQIFFFKKRTGSASCNPSDQTGRTLTQR